MANTLFLQLEGPLQSWGERAQWSVRDSAAEPTKSGVVGLLACALGLREDDDLQRLSRSLRMGVRVDAPGAPVTDYHTVVGGVLSAEGKVKINANTKLPETVVSQRRYLCDAVFLVAVQSDDQELIARLAQAVQAPHWPFYLGRKSCPPSRPPFAGLGDYTSLQEALQAFPYQASRAVETAQLRAVLECGPGEGTLRREEIDSHTRRTFAPRYTRDVLLTVQVRQEVS